MASLMSVTDYTAWIENSEYVQTPNEESLYAEHIVNNGGLRAVIEGYRAQGRLIMAGALYGGTYRTEATGKWERWFSTVLKEIFAQPAIQFLPVYYRDPSVPGLITEKFRDAATLLKVVSNALWGNGSPAETQIAYFLGRLFFWEDFVDRYACGINGRAYVANYLEYIVRATKVQFGSNRNGPIGRSKSLKAMFTGKQMVDGFLLGNGLTMEGPLMVAKSDPHGKLTPDSWCGLSDGAPGAKFNGYITINSVRPSRGLTSQSWHLKPMERSTAFEARNTETGEKGHVIVASL